MSETDGTERDGQSGSDAERSEKSKINDPLTRTGQNPASAPWGSKGSEE